MVAQVYRDQLDRIKKTVKISYEGFKHNYDRFNEFRKFVFETSLSEDDITLLTTLSKPQIEFNITEAYISRLLGEFSKQEPSIAVTADDSDRADPLTIHVVEQHIRHMLLDSKNHHAKYEIMKDLYSGGFSVAKVWTDYANPMSFNQVINWDRVYDPTLCGFDLRARYSHKGDGQFCFELFPERKEDFEEENPEVNIDKLSFVRNFSGFSWSYTDADIPIVLVCDFYEKKNKEVKIVQLANNQVVTLKEYEDMLQKWDGVAQVPSIKGKPRKTTLETICRYRCIESEVIEYKETDFRFFPLVFFDGNSIILKNPKTTGNSRQYTRPYIYHAKGAQKLKNFSGITLANEIENIVQHKFMVAKEALPKEQGWLQAYKDYQKPSNLVYNAYYDEDPDKPIPNPITPVPRVNTPPEVVQSFTATDSLVQNILGSYDASLGINDNQLSGVAIVEGATQSNAAAMPYLVGFLQGLQRVAEIDVDLIPKYYKTPRTIPILGIDGKAASVKINQQDGIDIFYDSNDLNVKVEAGVSFQIQKSRALQQIIALMQASPLFAQFMNEKGLPVLLDNIEIRGIEQLKLMVDGWMKELAQQKQMALQQQQQEMQNNPAVMRNQIEMAKLQQKGQENQAKFVIDMQQLKQDEMKVLADAEMARQSNAVQALKAQTERFAKQVDLAIKKTDMDHKHAKESIEVHHHINQPPKQTNNGAVA